MLLCTFFETGSLVFHPLVFITATVVDKTAFLWKSILLIVAYSLYICMHIYYGRVSS